jgi:hypothetical protein
MTFRRRLAVTAALLAGLLGLAGQQTATADEAVTKRRTWGCIHVAGIRVGACLDDPLNGLGQGG